MSDDLEVAIEAATWKLEEAQRVVADPAASPEDREQARVHIVMMENVLAKATATLDASARQRRDRQIVAEFVSIVRAYRVVQDGDPRARPSQEAVARELGIVERTLVDKVRGLGIASWHDVHALVRAMR